MRTHFITAILIVFFVTTGITFPLYAEETDASQEQAAPQDPLTELKTNAEKGDSDSQFQLGKMYQRGEDVTQNDFEALKWIKLAAEQGNTDAQINLGVVYRSGSGVPMDNVTSYMWFEIAAMMGNEKGVRLRKDTSLPDDDIQVARQKAKEWMTIHNFKPVVVETKTDEKPHKEE